MIHTILAYWKIEVGAIAVALGIGFLANDFTSPKVLAVMVFLSDWDMLWTWEWWTRMIIFLTIGTAAWWFQKRKHDRNLAAQQTEWAGKVAALQGELRHSELLLAGMRVEIAVLKGRAGGQ